MAKQYPQPFLRSDRGKVFYFVYTDRTGRRLIRSTGCDTKKRAREYIESFIEREERGVGITFREYAGPFFIPGRCPRQSRRVLEGRNFGTTHMEKSRDWLERYILTDPIFPDIPMNEIRRRDVLDLRARLASKHGDKLNTVGKAIETVKAILSEAVFREDIPSNPGSSVTPPQYEEQEKGAFTAAEACAIYAALSDLVATDKAKVPERGRRPRMEAFFAAQFLGGLRTGEARAWRWGDVDLEARRFQVVRAVKDRHGTIGLPKWDKVRTGLALPSLLADRLRQWREYLEPSGFTDPDDLVFSNADGRSPSDTVVRKAWARLLTHARKKDILAHDDRWLTPHSCRHTLNTYLLSVGVAPLSVQLYLGWQSQETKALTRVQEGYTAFSLLDTTAAAREIDRLYTTGADQAGDRAPHRQAR